MIKVKVPARICFYGDHQDYLGLPVIAGTINRFVEIKAEPIPAKEFQISLEDLGEHKTIFLDDALQSIHKGDYFRSAMAVLKPKGFVFDRGFAIKISGNIPLNAGLSSSSALVVAWIRFLIAIQEEPAEVSNAEIGHWAYEAEVRYFNQPGGLMDQYTIAKQGLLYIDTTTNQTERLDGNLGKLVVAESGIAKQTLGVLKNGRAYQENAIAEVKKVNPDFDLQDAVIGDYELYLNEISPEYRSHWYATIHNYIITKRAKTLLSSKENNTVELGKLMNEHQIILQDRIKNTPPIMTKMMESTLNAGAIGAKTIGSGGGGCMVAMVNDDTKERVIDAFLQNGAKAAYEVELTYP